MKHPFARAPWVAVAAFLSSGPTAPLAAEANGVPAYRATYQVEYKGRNVGTSEHSVAYDAGKDAYTFSSRTTAKGLLRLATPNPAIEQSEFTVIDGAIRPRAFHFEDGSRSDEDTLDLEFDWERNVAIATQGGGQRQYAISAGVLDRGSLQVALMRDLARGQTPARYRLADEAAVEEYEYTANGTEQVSTEVGPLATVVYVQKRAGSSRETWLWLAPKLEYLPVRIEQRRDGETRTALLLQSVTGIGGESAAGRPATRRRGSR